MTTDDTVNLNEEWPDGTFGGPRPIYGWTPAEQAAHRDALETALRNP